MRRAPTYRLAGAVFLIGVASGCGAGRAGAPPAPATGAPQPATAVLGRATLSIAVTRAAAAAHHLAYVSSATNAVTVSASNGGPPVTSTVTLGSVCPALAASGVCTFSVAAPLGNDTFTITALSAALQPLSAATAGPFPIAADLSNVLAPVVLNPVAGSFSVTGSVPYGSTAAVPLALTVRDAAGIAIAPPGVFVTAAGVPAPLVASTVWGSDTTTFSTSASCSDARSPLAQSTWSPAQTLYLCPRGDHSVGGEYQVTIGGAPVNFNIGYAGIPPNAVADAVPNAGPAVVNDLRGDEDRSTVALSAGPSPHQLALGTYTGGASAWAYCTDAAFAYGAVTYDPNGPYLIAAKTAYATLERFDPATLTATGGACTPNGSIETNTDATALLLRGGNLYVANTDDVSTGVNDLRAISTATMTATLGPVVVGCGWPHSIASDANRLYVGCDNSSNISVFSPATLSQTTITTAGPTYSYAVVGGDVDRPTTAYAVAGGEGRPLQIYALSSSSATLLYTFASTTDTLASRERSVAVGRGRRIYLLVANGSTKRVVRFDPEDRVLTDPAFTTALDGTQPQQLDRGYHGRIIVGGTDLATGRGGFAFWPN